MDSQLDVLRSARHEAGIVCAGWVFVPLACIGGWLFILDMMLVLIGMQEWISPILEVSLAFLVSSILFSCIAYIFARRNPQRIRKALADMSAHMELRLLSLEPELHNTHEFLARFEEYEISLAKAALKQEFEQQKASMVETVVESLKKLSAIDKDATRSMRLKNQDFFASIPRDIREGEAWLRDIELVEVPDPPHALIERMLASTESKALQESLQDRCAALQDHIALLRAIDAEAKRLLALPE